MCVCVCVWERDQQTLIYCLQQNAAGSKVNLSARHTIWIVDDTMATRGRESARVKQTAKRFKGYYCDRKGITITQNRVRDIKRPCNDI